ncbi:hypothetical protein HanRHA438_Chr14g0643041 [Helianthus annuus]|nr:hypothetical protein HanRHA438_Chr14g0643041 [Helianthus annuus]
MIKSSSSSTSPALLTKDTQPKRKRNRRKVLEIENIERKICGRFSEPRAGESPATGPHTATSDEPRVQV